VHRCWIYAAAMAVCIIALSGPGYASPEIRATGTARPSDDPGFEGYWEYCYEVHWTGLPHAVSHIEILLCPPEGCACGCEAELFAFADTAGVGSGPEEHLPVNYYGALENSGDPSTGLEGMLLKFEPYEGSGEPGLEGSATLCFYSVAAPAVGSYPDRLSIKFGEENMQGLVDGVLPVCHQGFSPTAAKTWGYVKAIYR
jgi:hypothetical protein